MTWKNPQIRPTIKELEYRASVSLSLKHSLKAIRENDFILEEHTMDCEVIKDWSSRILSYTTTQKAFYDRMVPTID